MYLLYILICVLSLEITYNLFYLEHFSKKQDMYITFAYLSCNTYFICILHSECVKLHLGFETKQLGIIVTF